MPVTIVNTGTFNTGSTTAQAGLPAAGAAAGAATVTTATGNLQPPAGYAWFGAYPGSSADTTLAGYEGASGVLGGTRQLAAWYRYYSIYDEPTYPTANDISLASAGRIPVVYLATSFAIPPAGSSYTYAQVVSGTLDSQIDSIGARIALMPGPVFVTFSAEPDLASHSGYGSAADYIAAFRRVSTRLKAAAPGNVVMAFCTCHANAGAASYYPGDAWADWIGFDPYDVGTPPSSPASIYGTYFSWIDSDPFAAAGGAGSGGGHGKPMCIPETGCVQGTVHSAQDTAVAAWINAVPGVLAGWTSNWGSQIQMWQWFNSSGGAGNSAILVGSYSATAMQDIGAASIFNP